MFHRIIGQSGMAGLAPSYHHWAGDQAIRLGTELALMLGCTSPSTEHKLQCLKQQTPMALQVRFYGEMKLYMIKEIFSAGG